MPTTLLPVSGFIQILQNVAYALPARLVFINTSAAIEASLDGSLWAALTGANTTGVFVASGFIRCTTGNCNVVVRPE